MANLYKSPEKLRLIKSKKPHSRVVFYVGIDLSFQSVSRQVLSAQVSLTAVFGMGTGGPSPLKTPTIVNGCCQILPYLLSAVKQFWEIPPGCCHPGGMVHLQGLEPWTP